MNLEPTSVRPKRLMTVLMVTALVALGTLLAVTVATGASMLTPLGHVLLIVSAALFMAARTINSSHAHSSALALLVGLHALVPFAFVAGFSSFGAMWGHALVALYQSATLVAVAVLAYFLVSAQMRREQRGTGTVPGAGTDGHTAGRHDTVPMGSS